MYIKWLLTRIMVTAAVIVTISIIAFSLIYLTGDPAVALAGENASVEDIQNIRVAYGFDQPIYVQYGRWLYNAVHLDFGTSYYLRAPVYDVLLDHFPVTIKLGLLGLAFAIAISLSLGVVAALRQNTVFDRITTTIAVFGQAMPSFLLGLLLIYIFAVVLRWFPASGSSSWKSFILPSLALGYYANPVIMRMTRSGMLDALQSDHIRTARAYGLSRWRVVVRHAMRQALLPVVSLSAVELGFMLGGSIIIETVFSMKGIGYLAWISIQRSDLAVIQAILIIISTLYAVLITVGDLINMLLDPRLRVK